MTEALKQRPGLQQFAVICGDEAAEKMAGKFANDDEIAALLCQVHEPVRSRLKNCLAKARTFDDEQFEEVMELASNAIRDLRDMKARHTALLQQCTARN